MELVFCTSEYWEFVRELRIDDRVSSGFIENSKFSKGDQVKYMNCNQDFYRICLVNGNPAGYVGVINNDIRVCTHPDYQKMGVAKFMIDRALIIWPDAFAKIKISNISSIKLFESCGFKPKYIIYSND